MRARVPGQRLVRGSRRCSSRSGTTATIRTPISTVADERPSGPGTRAPTTTLPLSRAWPSMKSASRSSTASSVPDASPARDHVHVERRERRLGCASSAFAKLVPSFRLSRTLVRTRFSCSFSTCSMSASSDSTSGTPAPHQRRELARHDRDVGWSTAPAKSAKRSMLASWPSPSRSLSSVASVSRTPSLRSSARSALAFSASRTALDGLAAADEDAAVLEDGHGSALLVDDDVFLRRREDLFDRGHARRAPCARRRRAACPCPALIAARLMVCASALFRMSGPTASSIIRSS